MSTSSNFNSIELIEKAEIVKEQLEKNKVSGLDKRRNTLKL